MAAVNVSTVDAENLIERIRRIPDSLREYTESDRHAKRFHRVPEDVLERLLETGLPHKRGTGCNDLLSDNMDLRNIVLVLGITSPQKKALKATSRALVDGADEAPIRRTVNIQGKRRIPAPFPATGRCVFQLAQAVRKILPFRTHIGAAP